MYLRAIAQTIFGILTFIPGIYNWRAKKLGSGGSYSARYCYSVYLRHMVKAYESSLNTKPKVVAELGPGDSLGIGLMALLLGAEKYYAFDVVKFSDLSKNLVILEELITLLKQQENIPNDEEYPRVVPKLNNYEFPKNVYSDIYLKECLSEERIQKIKNSLFNSSMIEYKAPWFDDKNVQKNSVDMIISQAVLEHIDELDGTYKQLYQWLKNDGFMTHCIDFKSHGYAKTWDGHWKISKLRWFLLRGNRPYLINRKPYSIHFKLLKKHNFKFLKEVFIEKKPSFNNKRISKADSKISGAFIQVNK
ncbi:hypothetical protein MNB_SUP05-5-839 [hydrothermal vent metagenome]|uniref:Methyltransferase type 11 domain-containing protein n=1 Tax=hydrothermal vent metagenome TaxID=652676 RepID=A0A1W1BHX8_9ZZZZ